MADQNYIIAQAPGGSTWGILFPQDLMKGRIEMEINDVELDARKSELIALGHWLDMIPETLVDEVLLQGNVILSEYLKRINAPEDIQLLHGCTSIVAANKKELARDNYGAVQGFYQYFIDALNIIEKYGVKLQFDDIDTDKLVFENHQGKEQDAEAITQ